jgi:hypothetical protein
VPHIYKAGTLPLATPPVDFPLIILDGVSQTICPGWPLTEIFLILASQEARITGMSHWHLAPTGFILNLDFRK